MEPAYVIGGKLGDVLSVIALAQQQVEIPTIVTSKQYAPAIKDLPVKVVVYDGPWHDLKGLIKFAKKKFPKVIVPQTYGEEFPVKHTRPSFQLDQASRCGVDFEQCRLKISREPVSKEKTILLVDTSESSPFPHRDDLYGLLTSRFPDHKIVRAAEIEHPKFSDFLNTYDSVSAIVTIDTAHLHFTSATETPVIALTYDQPHRWRGSAWHPRFKFFCRYGDYPARKEQLVYALQMALDGKELPAVTLLPTTFPNAYNPSIARFKGTLVRAYRYNPDPLLWPTSIAIDGQPLIRPDSLNNCSLEDPRLFEFNDKLYLSYVMVPYPVPSVAPSPCAMGYGEIVKESEAWRLKEHIRPNIGRNNLTAQEKNWLFFEHDKKLHLIYQCSPEQIVYELNRDAMVREWKSNSPVCSFGDIRGGTQPIPYQGHWLRFFHTLVKTPTQEVFWQYNIGALLMEPTPPFRILAVSKHPILSGDERFFEDWKFYKSRVTICYGAIESEGGWIVSCGINDSRCADVFIKPDQLNL